MGWSTIALILGIPVLLVSVAYSAQKLQRSGDRSALSSGGLLGFDELFHPTAYDARIQWEAEQEIPAPAPTPDRGPGVIEYGSRITIVVHAGATQQSAETVRRRATSDCVHGARCAAHPSRRACPSEQSTRRGFRLNGAAPRRNV